MIYVAHPYGGNKNNIVKAGRLLIKLRKNNPKANLISPLHCWFWEDYNDDQDQALKFCLELLSKCDILFLASGWKDSPGCKTECEFAVKHGIRIIYEEEENGSISI